MNHRKFRFTISFIRRSSLLWPGSTSLARQVASYRRNT